MTGRGRELVGALALALACGVPDARAVLSLRRPVATDVRWRHCAAERLGETRPSSWCPERRLVAARSDVAVPADGTVTLALDASGALDGGPPLPDGPMLVVPDAATYAADGPPALRQFLESPAATRAALALLPDAELQAAAAANARPEDLAARRRLHDALGVRFATQAPLLADRLPQTVALRFAAADAGRRALAGAWAWPAPRARDVVALRPFVVRDGEGLAVSFAVPPPGWVAATPAVTFRVRAGRVGEPGAVLWSRRLDPAHQLADRGWHAAEVDLSTLAGKEIAVVLEAVVEDGRSFPMWGEPTLLAPVPDAARPPSVLLISLDTLRADDLDLYGAARPTSPALDAFAADAVVFEHATSTYSSTCASHLSMLTSLQPCAHGVLVPMGADGPRLPEKAATLADAFAAAGWATAAVTEDGLIKGDLGFDRGFDRYRDLVPDPDVATGYFPQGIALARAWIERHADQPFFFFLHTYQPHAVYKPPPHIAGRWAPGPTASEMDWWRAAYDEGILGTDELLGGFLDALKRRGILEHTIVVVTSDHGEAFDEHGEVGHGGGVHVEQVHVPLVIRHPTLAHGGRRVPDVVSLVDLAPTLLDLAGVPAPPTFTGRSLRPLLDGRPLPDAPPAFAELLYPARVTSARSGRWSWLLSERGIETYDVQRDPHETRDRSKDEPQVAARGRALIEEFRSACERTRAGLAAAAPSSPAPPTPGAVDPARQRALRALGYVQ